MITIDRSNTILYCARWREAVAFYRDVLGLSVSLSKEWFVELQLTGSSFLSLADAGRSSVRPGGGVGVTLTWRVADIDDVHRRLRERGVEAEDVREHPWGGRLFRFVDPEGHRVEIWSEEFDLEGTK